jgi:hypothetical protein
MCVALPWLLRQGLPRFAFRQDGGRNPTGTNARCARKRKSKIKMDPGLRRDDEVGRASRNEEEKKGDYQGPDPGGRRGFRTSML